MFMWPLLTWTCKNVFVLVLFVAVNNVINTEAQQCIPCITVLHTAASLMKHTLVCMKSVVCLILTKPGVARQIFVKGPIIKFHGNPSSGSRTCWGCRFICIALRTRVSVPKFVIQGPALVQKDVCSALTMEESCTSPPSTTTQRH
jgi:hypothetical protein